MGGNAFSEKLPTAVFPRMPLAFYNSLKSRIIPRLEALYHIVVVPPEAPGKLDFGDLDVLVCQPRNVKEGISLSECVTLEEIERALGSVHSIPLTGDRTSNFAIPIQRNEVQEFGIDEEEVDLGQLYIQIDLHFCEEEESLRSRSLFQSYGELGMILGVLGKSVGFTWSPGGLKVSDRRCLGLLFFFDRRAVPSAFSLRHLHPGPPVYPPDDRSAPNIRVFRSRPRRSRTGIHHLA